ncbi:MAG TPA: UDP-N-acetylmuramoyl-L-alanine--D-glutamate ligase [Acidimicrobiales bacterium]|nr:UDP-N-acetylmuramoyl-L-alanine--D-glutamate ligase [Acidimicrobiales bacterium]
MTADETAAVHGTAVVVGFGVTGRAAVEHLVRAGWRVIVVEDSVTEATARAVAFLGATLGTVADVTTADVVVPSPGVGPDHPVFAAGREAGAGVMSEVELAWRAAPDKRYVAVTGTNGKTTVTTLVAAMLAAAGRRVVAAGNIGLPLVTAVAGDADTVVVEVSSFQLQYTERFRPDVAVWLNLAQDHLDWHRSMEDYAAAKARIWANQGPDGVAVVNADDPGVMAAAGTAPGRVVTFGAAAGADWFVEGGSLRGPGGPVMAVADLPRSFPHDVSNALAAMAAATAAGADLVACAAGAARLEGLPHRVQLVGEAGGVRFYDDSKATTPASVVAALQAFDSVVLIAGGRNKGLDLRPLAGEGHRLRAVVAIGEAAHEVETALAGVAPVTVATSMGDAVRRAAAAAGPGDVVLLSPACASFDWYRSYAERGDDFTRHARSLMGAT